MNKSAKKQNSEIGNSVILEDIKESFWGSSGCSTNLFQEGQYGMCNNDTPAKGVNIQILGTCEYVTLHNEEDMQV